MSSLSVVRTLRALGAAVILSVPAHAQVTTRGEWFRRTIEAEQGLPETQVNAIAQTADGYLWLGTRRGLVRYDGIHFTIFAPDRHPGLPAYWVNALHVDSRGRLWISTERGLAVREGATFRTIDSSSVPFLDAWQVTEDGGNVLVAASTGVYRGDGERFHRISGAFHAYAIARDRAGRQWVAGRKTFARVRDAGIQPVAIEGWRGEPDFLDVIDDGEGGLFVAHRNGVARLAVTDRGARVVQWIDATLDGIRSAVYSLGRTPDGRLWIGSASHGVLTWDGTKLRQEAPGSTEQVWALFLDARRRMWAGTSVGLERFQLSPFATYGGLRPTRSTWSVRGDAGGDIWTATSAGALYKLHEGQHMEVLAPAERQTAPATWPAPGGGVYVAHDLRRILQVTSKGAVDLTPRYRLDAGDILGMFRDSRGTMWFSTDSGVYRSDGGVAHRVDASLGLLPGEPPRDIREDSKGRLLFGRPGLTVRDGARGRSYGVAEGLTDLDVLVVQPQRDNVWIGTADSGLYILRKDRIISLGHLDPRLHREIGGIGEDVSGHLWLSSSFGLTRASIADLVAAADGQPGTVGLRSFDRRDGLPTTEFNTDFQGAIARDAQGHLWFPSYLGPVRVDPDAVFPDTIPPQVHLEATVVDGTAHPVDLPLVLPPGTTRMEVTFAVTDAAEPSRVRVEFRMKGINNQWVPAGDRRTLGFGPLGGGDYELSIRAVNEEGLRTTAPAVLSVTVERAWYEEPWFVPALVAAAAAGAFVATRARQRRLVRRGQALEVEVRARTADLEAARTTLERRVEERTAQLAGELAERKRLGRQLVEAQKLESIGRLAGGVAHEINNSMTGVLGFTELAASAARDHPGILGDLAEVRRAGERVAEITRQLLAFARRQASRRVAVDLARVVRNLARSLQQLTGDAYVLDLDLPVATPSALVDIPHFEQVVLNLVLNARDAMPAGGTIGLRLRAEALDMEQTIGSSNLPAGTYLHLAVVDQGRGMSEEVLARLFEPFFTTKEVQEGTGLGLAVCHGIIAQHRGAIAAESAPGVGSTFHVWLPVADAAWEAEGPAAGATGNTGSETILVVEDEPSVREVARRGLEHHGYHVIEASDGAQALEVLEGVAHRVDLILSDVIMPNLDGLALAQAVRERGYDTPMVFMSGFVGRAPEVEAQIAAFGPSLLKPFTQQALALAVRKQLDTGTTSSPVPGRFSPN